MKKLLKAKVLIIFLFTSFFSIFLSPESNATSNVVPGNAYLSEEKAIFLDGEILITREKAYSIDKIKNPGTYVPVKLLSKLKNISIDYSKPITVKSNKGTYKINESN